jgi:hypothetical protein
MKTSTPTIQTVLVPTSYNLIGTITASDDQLRNSNLHFRFSTGDKVYAHADYDPGYYQISKNGKAWHSIPCDQIKIDE